MFGWSAIIVGTGEPTNGNAATMSEDRMPMLNMSLDIGKGAATGTCG